MMRKIVFIIGMLLCILLVVFNADAAAAAREGFLLWQNAVLPSLLPFFVCTSLLQRTGVLPPYCKAGLFILSFTSGAPSGARLCGNAEDSTDNTALIASLNVVSPMFIISGFCTQMLGIPAMAWPILIAQFISSLCMLLVIICKKRPMPSCSGASAPLSLVDCIKDAMNAMLNICGMIVVFMVAIRLLDKTCVLDVLAYPIAWLLSIFKFPADVAKVLLVGSIEMVNGCHALSSIHASTPVTAFVGAFLFSFGGLCIMAQSMVFAHIKPIKYLLFKFIQGTLSALIASIICPWFMRDVSAFLPFNEQELINNSISAAAVFASSLLGIAVVMLFCASVRKHHISKS
ncbi:MAG: hypothetical protein RRZ71_00775 [Clostridia bacterium]